MVLASSPVMSIVEPHQGLNYPGWGSRSLLILVDGSSLRPSLANSQLYGPELALGGRSREVYQCPSCMHLVRVSVPTINKT